MDIPFAFGVDYFVDNFPYGLPKELQKFGGDAFSRRAQERLNKHKFENPNLKATENSEDSKYEKSNNESKTDSPKLSLRDILHYEFMSV